jgi:hypothetical protein
MIAHPELEITGPVGETTPLVTGGDWYNPSIAHQYYRSSGPVFTGPSLSPRNKRAISRWR